MKTFTTVDLLKQFKDVTFAAAKGPVTITQHRKPRFVLMTYTDFERLANRDPRQVFRTAEAPEEVRLEIVDAVDELIGSDDDE